MEVPSIFLNKILLEAAKRNAYSLHLTVGSQPVLRINGELVAMEAEDLLTLEIIEKVISSFASAEEQERLKKNREIILVKTFAGSFRFRINIFYQKDLPSLTFRYIPEAIKSLKELRLPPAVNNVPKVKSGLFVIAGSHGSGKTATSAAIIEEINNNFKKRIITIEDPIENLFISKRSLIEQREVGRDLTSAVDGLQYSIEEDANVIYVGEIERELKEAMPLIMELASGNSLVLLEINADSVVRVIEKIFTYLKDKISPEVYRYNLSDILYGIIAQKLVPRVGGGMVLAAEVLLANPAAKSLIREGRIYQLESIMQTSRREGMINMAKALEELVKTGEIKLEENLN